MTIPNARPCAEKFDGRKVSRFFVTARQSNTHTFNVALLFSGWVTAHTAADAVDWVRDQFMHCPNTEVETRGPRGGRVERFIGWHSVIGNAIFSEQDHTHIPRQMNIGSIN